MEDDLKKRRKKRRRPKKNKKNEDDQKKNGKKSTKINLIGCDTIVNSPSYHFITDNQLPRIVYLSAYLYQRVNQTC